MPDSDADVAIAAALAGAAVARERYGSDPVRHSKSGVDFATDVDVDAEAAIVAWLRDARPGDAVVGEESGRHGPDVAARWLVDPICGTLNYAAGTPLAAVNVARVEPGAPAVAACADPIAGEVFWTDGRRAAVRRDGRDDPLEPSARSRLVDVSLSSTSRAEWFDGPALIGALIATGRYDVRVLSTSLALAWVAAGRRCAYVTPGDAADSVHFAAGLAIAAAAGCVVTALDGSPVGDGPGLLAAADAPTHADVLDALARQRRAR